MPVSNFNITISAEAATGTATFVLTPVNDNIDEDHETVTIMGTLSGVTVNDGMLSLTDDDPTPGITLSLSESVVQDGMATLVDLTTMAEDGGAKTVTVTATMTGSRFAAAKTVAVSVAGSGTDTAVDFATVSNFNIMIPAEAASATATFVLTPTNDVVTRTMRRSRCAAPCRG